MPAREDRVVEMGREKQDRFHGRESSGSKLRLALLAPLQELVPPRAYGGIESVVAALADGLVEAGQDVTLFARAGSHTKARLVTIVEELPQQPGRRVVAELDHALACFLRSEFDVINNHMGLLGAALGRATTPVVHTVSDPIDRTRAVWGKLAAWSPELPLISISRRQQALAPELPWVASIPNPVDIDRFPFQLNPDGYLAFLGRMSPDKGCDHAITVAKHLGLPLRIGAKLREAHEREYFEHAVRPHLDDRIEYLGELDHAEKAELLGNAIVTLVPVRVEEAFGLVVVESMACGTPVVAYRIGAMPEVVVDGRTGFLVDDEHAMLRAVERIGEIDRAECRRHVEQHFSVRRAVRAYVGCYQQALSRR
jgi:glycosyltransferase involved in cell wall biosynthesis